MTIITKGMIMKKKTTTMRMKGHEGQVPEKAALPPKKQRGRIGNNPA